MARIRTIKPEFWTDEKIVQLPFQARLLFIGLWNFADDDGRLIAEPDRIKMQIFPADTFAVDSLLDLLAAAELVTAYELADGRRVVVIQNFARHQKISHATPSRLPLAGAHKRTIPNEVRRAVAKKYGCTPGESLECECFYCGAKGEITWWRHSDGRPSMWVSFSIVEIDHFIPENSGGAITPENLVLACRFCNRSKGRSLPDDFLAKIAASIPEFSRTFRPEGKGREGNRRDSVPSELAPPAPPSEVSVLKTAEEPSPDDKTWLFNEGLEYLAKASGRSEERLRSSIGMWLKGIGNDPKRLRKIVEEASAQHVAEPVAWITAAIKARTSPEAKAAADQDAEYRSMRAAVEHYKNGGMWPVGLGMRPDQPNNPIDKRILEEFGYPTVWGKAATRSAS